MCRTTSPEWDGTEIRIVQQWWESLHIAIIVGYSWFEIGALLISIWANCINKGHITHLNNTILSEQVSYCVSAEYFDIKLTLQYLALWNLFHFYWLSSWCCCVYLSDFMFWNVHSIYNPFPATFTLKQVHSLPITADHRPCQNQIEASLVRCRTHVSRVPRGCRNKNLTFGISLISV